MLLASLLLLLPAITAAVGIPLNATNRNVPSYHCTDSERWTGGGFGRGHCSAAIAKFFDMKVTTYGDRKFEFLAEGVFPSGRVPTVYTPRRYVSYPCTLAIVMLDFFVDGDLPGEEKGLIYPPRDIVSFREIWLAARLLEFGCVESKNQLGWVATGESQSIGVFLWTTGSSIDMLVPRTPSIASSTATNLTVATS